MINEEKKALEIFQERREKIKKVKDWSDKIYQLHDLLIKINTNNYDKLQITGEELQLIELPSFIISHLNIDKLLNDLIFSFNDHLENTTKDYLENE